jgi:hypothetical protein
LAKDRTPHNDRGKNNHQRACPTSASAAATPFAIKRDNIEHILHQSFSGVIVVAGIQGSSPNIRIKKGSPTSFRNSQF